MEDNENRCVYCQGIIPEGRQVCPNCEIEQTPSKNTNKEASTMQVNLKKIRGLMAEHDDTREKLADKIGVSTTTIGNYLTGKTKMTVKTLGLIASIYNVDFNELLEKV